ncbi:MAG: diacylglycerol kinase family lipid kinase [Bacteroidales bacterium]|nr:diacylglycerol kinase family lipid kinase [Bacteroidales bacterium]MBN2699419.1 diacylglycerol kinase family lipid kinase [Bacteroidales bacterium]
MKNAWLTIVNITAGGGKAGKDWLQIRNLLEKHQVNYQAEFTDRRLHAMVIARRKIEEGFNKIIVVGGDGTMNEVINGLFAQKRLKTTEVMLGMIAVGTGNDWARMFNIPSDYEKAILTIKNRKTFIQDAGLVTYKRNGRTWQRYFINIAGMGFGAKVVEKTNRQKDRGKSSPALYLCNLFTSLIRYRSTKARILIDGQLIDRKVFSMNVGIGKYNGGGMMQVPDAIADDGLYSITLIKRIGRLNVLANIKRLYNGKITEHSKVETYTAREISVDSPTRLQLETDGETLGHAPLDFQIIPRSIKVISGELSA